MSLRFQFWYWVETVAWRIGTTLREWACVHAGGEHDYLTEHVEDVCIVCGHDRGSPR